MNQNTSASDELEYILNKYELMENGLPAYADLRLTKDKFRDSIVKWHNDKLTEVLNQLLDERVSHFTQWGGSQGEAVPTEAIQAELNQLPSNQDIDYGGGNRG